MESAFWNVRYGETEYAYGKEPNDFLKEHSDMIQGKVLCLAEGEGRNAVYLALLGADVTCIDYAEEGLKKTIQLAHEKDVDISTICADLQLTVLEKEAWDSIVIIFGHFAPDVRKKVHRQLYGALRSGGKLIIEAYNKNQVRYKSGGPMNPELLYSKVDLEDDFKDFEFLEIRECERIVQEGEFHNGMAAVVQVIGKKPLGI